MGRGIEADAPIDYASFQIFPAQNRYETFVCSADRVEKLAEGPLQHLLPHLPEVKGLCARGSNSIFKLQLPENLTGASWFTKLTLERFLCIIHSSELMCTINATKEEVSQLEEARQFHLSLYTKNNPDHLESGEADAYKLVDEVHLLEPNVETASSDASKNELLQAMEMRLTALKTELTAAFNQAIGCTLSKKEVSDLAELSRYVGAEDLKESVDKVLEVSQECGASDSVNENKRSFTRNSINKTEENTLLQKPPHPVAPVKYGASPAKVAEIERQSSTESDESSDSGDKDEASVERSRSCARSAAPRRSASPMRRIQLGRAGLRRPTALTIRSLNYIPARDKTFCHREEAASNSDADESERGKNAVIHVRRLSVQDAINLFESKQRDQSEDVHKRSQPQASVGTNKCVLRRWSAGMGESSNSQPDTVSEDSVPLNPNVTMTAEIEKGTAEEKLNSDSASRGDDHGDSAEVDADLQHASDEVENQKDSETTQEDNSERPSASAEWSQQKEAELDQMLMKMMENNSGKYQKSHNSRNQSTSTEKRGGFYDNYKVKRDEKLRENAGKKADKEVKFKVIQKIVDEKKAEMVSVSVNDADKKQGVPKSLKSHKNPSVTATSKKETSKPLTTKRVLSKTSSLPATRKSWPSAPSPRATVMSPGKTTGGIPSVGSTTRRKTQPATSLAQLSSKKVEKSPQPQRSRKALQTNVDKNLKGLTEKRQPTINKAGKLTMTKTKAGTVYSDTSRVVQIKSKVTKKSSVVPVEPKPFLRKGSRVGPGVVPATTRKKSSSPSGKTQKNCGSLTEAEDMEVVNVSDTVSQPQEVNIVSLDQCDSTIEPESLVNNDQKCVVTENYDQVFVDNTHIIKNMEDFSSRIQDEEVCVISPRAWVEIEEHQDIPSPCDNEPSQLASSVNAAPVEMSRSRVRHSLSQMLQEESSEPDTNKWGYAENPPAIVYQRDAPKGLKRLLKFARKSKGDSNTSGWSSPSVFSDGEDDSEEFKTISRRNSDNLLRKAALNAKNFGTQKTLHEGHERNFDAYELAPDPSNSSNFNTQRSFKRQQEGRISAGVASTKASRSFFSLSAFRGSKPNETKLR